MVWSMGAVVPIDRVASDVIIGEMYQDWETRNFQSMANFPTALEQSGITAASLNGLVASVQNPLAPETLKVATFGNADDVGPGGLPAFVDLNIFTLRNVTLPALSPVTIAHSAVEISNNTSTAENNYITQTVLPVVGATQSLWLRAGGTFLPNDGSNVNYRPRLKLGGTTIYDDIASFSHGAVRQPWALDVLIANQNSLSSQLMIGLLFMGNNANAAAPTVGQGLLSATQPPRGGPISSNGLFSVDLSIQEQLEFTMQMGTSSATVDFVLSFFNLAIIG